MISYKFCMRFFDFRMVYDQLMRQNTVLHVHTCTHFLKLKDYPSVIQGEQDGRVYVEVPPKKSLLLTPQDPCLKRGLCLKDQPGTSATRMIND